MLSKCLLGDTNSHHRWTNKWRKNLRGIWSTFKMNKTILAHEKETSLAHEREKEMSTHSSILAWRIPGTEEPGGLPSLGLHRVRHDWSDLAAAAAAILTILKYPIYEHKMSFSFINFRYRFAAKSLQSCPTLCNPRDGSPPGSPVPGILQARTLKCVAISFSNAWKWKVKVKSLSCVQLLATPWTAAYQAPPSTGFSRQAYCSGVPLPSPRYRFKVT